MSSKFGLLPLVILISLFGNAVAQKSSFTFEQEKVHVVYSSYANPVKISSKLEYDSLTLEYDYYNVIWVDSDRYGDIVSVVYELFKGAGKVTRGEDKNSFFLWTSSGTSARLNIHLNGKVVEFRDYKIIQVPDPIVKCGNLGSSDATITLEELRNIKRLTCEKIDWEYEEQYVVESFKLSVYGPGKAWESAPSENGQLTPDMLNALSKAKTGEKIIIQDVRANLGDNYKVLPSLVYTISN